MQKTELDLILKELYDWNPKLKARESDLIRLIETMAEARPDTRFDSSFAQDLKKDLLSHRILFDEVEENKGFLFNLKNMNKKIYIATGAVVALGLVALVIILPNLSPALKRQTAILQIGDKTADSPFTKVAPGAFGSLVAMNSDTNTAAKELSSVRGEGGSTLASPVAPDSAATPSFATGLGGGGTASAMPSQVDSKIMPAQFSYTYVYKGDPLVLSEETGTVYRRIKGDGNLNSNLESLISSQSFGPLDMKNFSNLQTNYIALSENKKLGLSVNIDFREENIYIGENWTYWQSGRDKCGSDQACWDSYRLKISDIPADSDLIAMSNEFLSNHGINLEHYGTPSVDNNWRNDYERATDKNNYYIPEYANVVYPLVVNGQNVYDQSGNLDGLRVSVNLLQKAVSGVSNLLSFRYETSDYALETDQDRIISLAEKGGYGMGIYYFGNTQENITLELGTPTKTLIRFWRYSNNINDELLVPALVFPITNIPANYYGPKSITVPLAKEMVDELIKQKDNNNNNGGPILYEKAMPAAQGSGATSVIEPAPALIR